MPLHPELADFLELAAGAGGAPLWTRPVAEVRAAYDATSGALDQADTAGDEQVQAWVLRDPAAPTVAGVPARLYRPSAAMPVPEAGWPVLLYFHGGGYVLGGLDSHDLLCRSLATHTPCAVLSVDYRRAPEHPFPAAFEDAVQAYRWLRSTEAQAALAPLRLDTRRVVVGGDSVGGTLATVLALSARDAGWPAPAGQVLLYPCTSPWQDTPSHRDFARGYLLEGPTLQWMFSHCLRDEADRGDWRFAPLLAPDVSTLPPVFMALAEFDPLVDEGRAYAQRLSSAGVAVELKHFDGMVHDFARLGALVDEAFEVKQDMARAMRAFFKSFMQDHGSPRARSARKRRPPPGWGR